MNITVTGTATLLVDYEVTLEDITASEFAQLSNRERAVLIDKALRKKRLRVDFTEDADDLGVQHVAEQE